MSSELHTDLLRSKQSCHWTGMKSIPPIDIHHHGRTESMSSCLNRHKCQIHDTCWNQWHSSQSKWELNNLPRRNLDHKGTHRVNCRAHEPSSLQNGCRGSQSKLGFGIANQRTQWCSCNSEALHRIHFGGKQRNRWPRDQSKLDTDNSHLRSPHCRNKCQRRCTSLLSCRQYFRLKEWRSKTETHNSRHHVENRTNTCSESCNYHCCYNCCSRSRGLQSTQQVHIPFRQSVDRKDNSVVPHTTHDHCTRFQSRLRGC
mmetsp:Transcript_6656/g.24906  ORF Transcript_6656/g.24906 Transcript_6656/m.24906 type:complete len:257 (+) Transcript_6656:79-849(+)